MKNEPESPSEEPTQTSLQNTETEPDSAETEPFAAPDVKPVVRELEKGCYYGEKTDTDLTYTGLEPLPLSDFNNPSFENSDHLSEKTIDHSYGVAKDERPHDISVANQTFFNTNGYDAICYNADVTDKTVYLTFDCGYENGYTAKILDTLRDKGVNAAFFCTLPQMEENPDLIARMINEGHIVGNHSVTHPDFSSISRKQMYEELKGFDDYLRTHFGYSASYFRYPQGKYSENSLQMLNSMGYTCVFWSLAYADWDLNDQKGPEYALNTVIDRIHPGAVILLHAVSPDNANALASIIDTVQSMGYKFAPLSSIQ